MVLGSVADRSATDPAFMEAMAGGGRTKAASKVGCFSRAAISKDGVGVRGKAGCGILRALSASTLAVAHSVCERCLLAERGTGVM
jgi:hypothetical protein